MNQGSVVIENNDIFFFIASTILSQLCTCFWAAVDGRSAKQKHRLFVKFRTKEIIYRLGYVVFPRCIRVNLPLSNEVTGDRIYYF